MSKNPQMWKRGAGWRSLCVMSFKAVALAVPPPTVRLSLASAARRVRLCASGGKAVGGLRPGASPRACCRRPRRRALAPLRLCALCVGRRSACFSLCAAGCGPRAPPPAQFDGAVAPPVAPACLVGGGAGLVGGRCRRLLKTRNYRLRFFIGKRKKRRQPPALSL